MSKRTLRPLIATALPLMLVLAACSSSKKGLSSNSNGSGANSGAAVTAKSASAPAPPAPPTKTPITTDDGNHYTVTITPKAPQTGAPCAGNNTSGRIIVPFTVDIHNDSGKEVPEPGLGIAPDDPTGTGSVAAMSVQGVCLDFVLTGVKVAPNASATYEGSLSNATANAKLGITIKNNGPGTPSGFSVPLFAK